MMGYEGEDLLLTSVVGQRSDSPPRPVCASCGRWLGWPAALVQWRERIRGGLTAGPPPWLPALRRTRRWAI